MIQDLNLLSYLIICISAFLTSGLTLFTGFGLGTLLMPVFAIFFPIDIAIALTALVHLANNLFKLSLFGRYANKKTVIYFGLPALLASFIGAKCLIWFSHFNPIAHYKFFGQEFEVLPINIMMSILMIAFAMLELIPKLQGTLFQRSSAIRALFQYPRAFCRPLGQGTSPSARQSSGFLQSSAKQPFRVRIRIGLGHDKHLAIGGILSGFFGGLSGHQGAFRSAFLVKAGLSKESFIGTGVVIACLVDTIRIFVYGSHFMLAQIRENGPLLIFAMLSAFLGVKIGSLLVKKITIKKLQTIVAVLLVVIAIILGTGLLSMVNTR